MLEFLEKNLAFFIIVTIVGSYVMYSVKKDRKEEEKRNAQKKAEESQKKEEK